MSEVNPFMAMILGHSSFVGPAEDVQEKIVPLPEQQALGEGDIALVASANTPLEGDFTVARVLEPIQYESTFPDWQDRMLLSDHVLCEFFSREDTEFSIGWVHRLKLLPIKKYRYRELRRWRKQGFPDELPEWVLKYYRAYTDKMAEQSPETVPVAVTCPNCQKRNVELKVVRTLTWTARAGLMKYDGEMRFLPVNEPTMDSEHVAQLICTDCGHVGDMEDSEWVLPDISN